MKKIISLLLITSALVWSACNFSAGTNKDLGTGLSYTYNGFTVAEVVLAGPDNTAMTAVINETDLFAGGEGYPATDAAILRGTVTVGDPMVAGETYHVKMRIWDKNKPENELTAEVDLVVK
jgi:predicted small secreted protein